MGVAPHLRIHLRSGAEHNQSTLAGSTECFKIEGVIRSLPLVEGRHKWNLWLDLGMFVGETVMLSKMN
jgi:hypothetical protein